MRLKVKSIVVPMLMVLVGLFLSACTTPGVDKALGTGAGADAAHPVVVTTSPSTVVIENHAGRPLLNVRVAVEATGSTLPFVKIVPAVDTAETTTLRLTDFRTDEAVMFDLGAATPKQVTVTARDTMSETYEASASW
jgi:type IV secretory pathway VirB6-like protein